MLKIRLRQRKLQMQSGLQSEQQKLNLKLKGTDLNGFSMLRVCQSLPQATSMTAPRLKHVPKPDKQM